MISPLLVELMRSFKVVPLAIVIGAESVTSAVDSMTSVAPLVVVTRGAVNDDVASSKPPESTVMAESIVAWICSVPADTIVAPV